MASERILSKEEIETALNERHSPEKQKLLSVGQVTIAGLGGLGSNVAYSLARIGGYYQFESAAVFHGAYRNV